MCAPLTHVVCVSQGKELEGLAEMDMELQKIAAKLHDRDEWMNEMGTG